MIANNSIAVRVDSHAGALLSCKEDARALTYTAAFKSAEQYLRDTKTMLLRAGMLRHDLIQRPAGGAGERPERPERPDRAEGPRSGGYMRGEGNARRRGVRGGGRGGGGGGRNGDGAGPSGGGGGGGPGGWASRLVEGLGMAFSGVDSGSGSMLAD